MSESESWKNAVLRSGGSSIARGDSYIVIELVVLVLVELVEIVVIIQHIVLEGFAGEVVNGTRNDLWDVSSPKEGELKHHYLLFHILADLIIHLQFFFELL